MKDFRMEFAKFLHQGIGVNIVKDFGKMNWDFDYNNITGNITINFSPVIGVASILETEDKILTLYYLCDGVLPYFALTWDISNTVMMYPERIDEIEHNLKLTAIKEGFDFNIGSELVHEFTIAEAKDKGLKELIEKSWFGKFYLGKELLFDPSIPVDEDEDGDDDYGNTELMDFLLKKQSDHIAGVAEWSKLPEKERKLKETERGYRTRTLGIMEKFVGTEFDSPEAFCEREIIDELLAIKNVGLRVIEEIKVILEEEGLEPEWTLEEVKYQVNKRKSQTNGNYKKQKRSK